jgi:transcriptional regulator with XRE-family HTH domain
MRGTDTHRGAPEYTCTESFSGCMLALMPTPLQTARERAGLTQEKLGELVGCTQATVSRAENGQPVSPELAASLAKALQISELEILYPDRYAA